jgi:hypothetical protein
MHVKFAIMMMLTCDFLNMHVLSVTCKKNVTMARRVSSLSRGGLGGTPRGRQPGSGLRQKDNGFPWPTWTGLQEIFFYLRSRKFGERREKEKRTKIGSKDVSTFLGVGASVRLLLTDLRGEVQVPRHSPMA